MQWIAQNKFSIRWFIYLIAMIASIYLLTAPIPYFETQWFILSAVIFSFGSVTLLSHIRFESTIMIGLFSALLVFIGGVMDGNPLLSGVFILMIALIMMHLRKRYPALQLLLLGALFFTVLSIYIKIPFNDNLNRSLFIAGGALLIAALQWLILPRKNAEIEYEIEKLLKQYQRLTEDIFACFLEQQYPTTLYLFEHRLHQQKNKCMQLLVRLERLLSNQNQLFNKLSFIFDVLMEVALLRFRVKDHTTYEICNAELLAIDEALQANFNLKNHIENQLLLRESIKRLENNYQQVLQVAAPDPMVFLFFIASLKSLAEAIDDLLQQLQK